jgi:hypothetical protein
VDITLPTSFIPELLASINGLDKHPILLTLSLALLENTFSGAGRVFDISNPLMGVLFRGRILITKAAAHFFSSSYRPRREYRSAVYVMEPLGIARDGEIAALASEGFSIAAASRALRLTGNDIGRAREFLLTSVLGATRWAPTLPEVPFEQSALFFFVLEVIEAICDLQRRCCMCGDPLGISVLRPSLCDAEVCFFGATELGLYANVVADFLVSLASSAQNTKWFTPPIHGRKLKLNIAHLLTSPPFSVRSLS